ncbi:Uncharacterized protein APZ42_010017, partial [Daphnia magna]
VTDESRTRIRLLKYGYNTQRATRKRKYTTIKENRTRLIFKTYVWETLV